VKTLPPLAFQEGEKAPGLRSSGQRSSIPKCSAMRPLYSSSDRFPPSAIHVSSLMRGRREFLILRFYWFVNVLRRA